MDTIVAQSTASGRAGVGIIRVSGPLCEQIVEKVIKKIPEIKVATFGLFYDEKDEIIDQGFVLYFKSPFSFTGEDILEFHAHGSPIVLDSLLRRILELGARLALPGEFSQRAFLNGKLDLTQAEAIADLINAQSERAAHLAVRSLQGEFSHCIHNLVHLIKELRIYIEGSIDFPEEEIDFLTEENIIERLNPILIELRKIKQSTKQGVLLQEGMSIVIAGRPNAGKSSLLNALSGRDSAIVTDIPGTTRDVLREYIHIDGLPLHIIDTAGLRETTKDKIEAEGIERAWKEIDKADKILLIIDSSLKKETDPKEILPKFFEKLKNKKPTTIIKNKIDLTGEKSRVEKEGDHTVIYLSIKNKEGIELLKKHLEEYIGFNADEEGLFIARRRHLDALRRAEQFVISAKEQYQKRAGELMAEDLREAQQALSEITGEFTSDDLLGEIFSTFCIGK